MAFRDMARSATFWDSKALQSQRSLSKFSLKLVTVLINVSFDCPSLALASSQPTTSLAAFKLSLALRVVCTGQGLLPLGRAPQQAEG